jgi:DNA polymerase-3 subunit gamma/tau
LADPPATASPVAAADPAPAPASAAAPAPAIEPAPPTTKPPLDQERWLQLVARSGLKGPVRELAAHAVFLGHADGVLRLGLSPQDKLLDTEASNRALALALASELGDTTLRFETTADAAGETLRQRSDRQRDARQEAAEASFMADAGVQQLIQRHGAQLVPDSIRPHDEQG